MTTTDGIEVVRCTRTGFTLIRLHGAIAVCKCGAVLWFDAQAAQAHLTLHQHFVRKLPIARA